MNQRELTAALESMTKERNKLLKQLEAAGGAAAVDQMQRDHSRQLESLKLENKHLTERMQVVVADNEKLEAELRQSQDRIQELAKELEKDEPKKVEPVEPAEEKKEPLGLTEPFSGQIPNDPDAPVADHAKDDAKDDEDDEDDSPLV